MLREAVSAADLLQLRALRRVLVRKAKPILVMDVEIPDRDEVDSLAVVKLVLLLEAPYRVNFPLVRRTISDTQ